MKHIREVDQARTVIMMQVENEVGVLGDSRDRNDAANAAFAKSVPKELTDYLVQNRINLSPKLRQIWEFNGAKTNGTWTEVFGRTLAADEVFMAWNYAKFLNRVTAAGKKEYPLPMFVNAWIVQPEDRAPGDYLSGGPQEHNYDVWRAAAPDIDFLAPDIYLPDFPEIVHAIRATKIRCSSPNQWLARKASPTLFIRLDNIKRLAIRRSASNRARPILKTAQFPKATRFCRNCRR